MFAPYQILCEPPRPALNTADLHGECRRFLAGSYFPSWDEPGARGTVERASLIRELLENHDEQKAALEMLDRAEARGKRPTNAEIRELIDFVKNGPRESIEQNQTSLFGEDVVEKNLAFEKAEVSDVIRERLSQ